LLALVLGLAAFAPFRGGGGEPLAAQQMLSLQPIGAFQYPTFATAPPGDQDRLLVVQKTGKIILVLDGVVQPTPFLDATSWITTAGAEQGLLSMAFPPDYATSGRFYIDYTAANTGAMTVDEVQRDASNPNVANPSTRRQVIAIPHPAATNHNSGQLEFGPDDMLYVGTGDGSEAGDPSFNAQNLQDLRGKLLRIDPRANGPNPYRVPPNNPFVSQTNADPEIWSYGLRNPWRFSFDRVTGDLNIGEVGQDSWEEIDFRPVDLSWGSGANFGWSCYEGLAVFNVCSPPPANPIWPVFAYPHSGAHSGCAISGGYVVRDPGLTMLNGRYLYGDFCSGHIYSQLLGIPNSSGDQDTGLSVPQLASFGEDACGHVYAVGVTGGGGTNVFRIQQDSGLLGCIPAFRKRPVLKASVGPGFEIHMYGPAGQGLDGHTLPEGSYTLEIDDQSNIHNFHLVGASVSCVPQSSCATSVAGTGHQTWTINVLPGTVGYQCDPHAGTMHGTFTVTADRPPPSPSSARVP
jgi:glucose/arabinose dehydrogenase